MSALPLPPPVRPIRVGPVEIDIPVVLAPMTGVTDLPFRTLVRRYGSGLNVTEMIASEAAIRETRQSIQKAAWAPIEDPVSMQLVGCDPVSMGEAAKLAIDAANLEALRREIVAEVVKYDGPYTYLDGLILDVTQSITTVEGTTLRVNSSLQVIDALSRPANIIATDVLTSNGVVHTIARGRSVMRDGMLAADGVGTGRYVARKLG